MSSRAGIVVTGTEVLTGRVTDRNGPWLAEQLRRLGVDVAAVIVVGDRPTDLADALEHFARSGVDLIITSGGLGPTADDLTAEIVARVQRRPVALDPDLERRVRGIIDRLSAGRGWSLDPEATAAGARKQAQVPAGAGVLDPVGTAPGLVVPPPDRTDGPPVVVLPGPPGELRPMWPQALAHPAVAAALAGAEPINQRTIRLWGTPESELAATMREHATELGGLEVTTCLRDGELEIVTRFGPDAAAAYAAFERIVVDRYPQTLFSTDGRTVDDIVTDTLLERGLTIATAESCTAGLLAGRLADRPGASGWLLGGLVTYSNRAKTDLLGVAAELIDEHGAVSEPVALAMARGARDRVGAAVGVGVTGVTGPDGGTADKPVWLVHFAVSDADGDLARHVRIPGGRSDVRQRATTVALHLVHDLLTR